jgi:hypothetical protein
MKNLIKTCNLFLLIFFSFFIQSCENDNDLSNSINQTEISNVKSWYLKEDFKLSKNYYFPKFLDWKNAEITNDTIKISTIEKNNEFVFKNQNHEKIILRTTPILLIIKKGNNDYDIFLKVYFNDIKKNNYHIYDKNGKLIVKNFSNSEKSINEKSGNCQL